MEKYTDKYHPEFIPGTYSIYSSAILQQQQDKLERQHLLEQRDQERISKAHNYHSNQNSKNKNHKKHRRGDDFSRPRKKPKKSPTTLHKLKTKYGVILFPQPTDSPNDPLNWSSKRKALHFLCLIAITGFTSATSNSASASSDSLNEIYGISYDAMNTGAGVLFFSIGLGTWLISPLEALYGRRISNVICLVAGIVGCLWYANVNNTGGAIWTQLFVGFSEACTEAQVQVSLSSIFFRHQMGAVVTIYILATSVGTYLGPLITGFISSAQTYTWVGWWGAIIGGIMLLLILFFFEEDKFNYNIYRPTYDGEKTKFYYDKKLKTFKNQIYQESVSNYQPSENDKSKNATAVANAINHSLFSNESDKEYHKSTNSATSPTTADKISLNTELSPKRSQTIVPAPIAANSKISKLLQEEMKKENEASVAGQHSRPPSILNRSTVPSPTNTNNTSRPFHFKQKAISFVSPSNSLTHPFSKYTPSVSDSHKSQKLVETKAIDMINNSVPVIIYQRNNGKGEKPWSLGRRLALVTRNSTNYENIEDNKIEDETDKKKFGFNRYSIDSFASGAKKDILKYFKLLWLNLTCLIFPGVILSGLMWGSQDAFLSFYLTTEDTVFYDAPWNFSDKRVAIMNIPCLIGAIIGCIYAGSATDYFVLWMARRNGGLVESEYRLWFAFFCGIIGPIGLLMFGIGTEQYLNWRVVYVGLGFIGFGWGCSGDLAMTYLIDSYPELVLETMVAVALINNFIGAIFTFVCSPWLDGMGTQNTYIVLAAIEFFIMFLSAAYIKWGKGWRKWTKRYYIQIIEARDGF